MKKSVFVAASLLTGTCVTMPVSPVRAQVAPAQVQPTYSTYPAAMEAGEKLFAGRKYKESRDAFTAALVLAKTPMEKADALMAAARTHEKEVVIEEIKSGKFATRKRSYTDYPAARLKYAEVEKLADLPTEKVYEAKLASASTYVLEPNTAKALEEFGKLIADENAPSGVKSAAYIGRVNITLKKTFLGAADSTAAYADAEKALRLEKVPDVPRADALLAMAELNSRFLKNEGALENLKAVVALPGASHGQKAKAHLMSGNYYFRAKQPEQARAAWSQVPLLMGASSEDKMTAYQGVAQIYLGEMKIDLAAAELDKAAQLPELTVFQKATIYENMGDLQVNAGRFAGAREAYAKIVALPDAGPLRHKDAIMKSGQSYLLEKNPAAARTEWEKLAAKKDTWAGDALRQIGLSFANENKFGEARGAFERWIALPIDNYWKEDAHLLMGQVYEQENNWTAARESFQKLIPDAKARASRRIRAVLGVVRTYEAEKNEAGALQAIELLPAAFETMGQLSPAETGEVVQARNALTKQLSQLAAERGKEKAKLASAVAIYRVVEKIYFLDSDKLEAVLAVADLYLGHGMPEEAKAEYNKVSNSPRASNAQLAKAKAKLKEIEDKAKPAAPAN